MATIYMARNTVNGKIYVGKTLLTLEQRMKKHLSVRHAPRQVFQKAILKYGPESFVWSTLDFVPDDKVDLAEQRWILALCATDPKLGYNRSVGGEGGRNAFPDSAETRAAKAAGMFGNKNAAGPRKTPMSDEHKSKISAACLGKKKSVRLVARKDQ